MGVNFIFQGGQFTEPQTATNVKFINHSKL